MKTIYSAITRATKNTKHQKREPYMIKRRIGATNYTCNALYLVDNVTKNLTILNARNSQIRQNKTWQTYCGST